MHDGLHDMKLNGEKSQLQLSEFVQMQPPILLLGKRYAAER